MTSLLQFSSLPAGGGAQTWSTIPIGGGGYCDGIDIAPDGLTTVVKSDTHPAPYLKSGSRFLPLSIATSMPAIYVGTRNNTDKLAVGVWEVRICPSITSKFYMITVDPAGKLFVTTNAGTTWTELANFPAQGDLESNDQYRSYCYRMAVDPQNDNILFIGTVSKGLHRSLDGGVTWSVRTVVAPGLAPRLSECWWRSTQNLHSPAAQRRDCSLGATVMASTTP